MYRRSVFGDAGSGPLPSPQPGDDYLATHGVLPPLTSAPPPSPQAVALRYSVFGAMVGVLVSWAIIWRKYPQATRGVYGAAMVLPVLGVTAGQAFALRKV